MVKMSTLAVGVTVLTLAMASISVAQPLVANPYGPTEVCNRGSGHIGSGYRVIDSHSISGATIYLLWNGAYNCVATIKTVRIGSKSKTSAGLAVEGEYGPGYYYLDDVGSYRYYAGPFSKWAPGYCIQWGGGATDANGRYREWRSPTGVHCG
jgi:hypothetical protein